MVAHTAESLQAILDHQRQAFLHEGEVKLTRRRDRLDRCIAMLRQHEDAVCEALNNDFGQRPATVTRFTDVFPALSALSYARDNLKSWARARHHTPRIGTWIPGAKASVVYQPIGVVGIISPWNFPINLTFAPLAGALAAGNRCMLKPSEHTRQTSELLERMVAATFDQSEVAVCTGSAAVGAAFAALPFDHLLFTGSVAVGRRVMAAAAENLVPVTLELGGKCPVIIGRSAGLERAVDRILLAKLLNAGQICLAPDYVLLPREKIDEFIKLARKWVAHSYGAPHRSQDYTSIINPQHRERLRAYLDDARSRGAEIVELGADAGAADNPSDSQRLLPPALIIGATATMSVMREEIFGPILPLIPYDDIEAAVEFVRARPRPLALYWFGNDRAEEKAVLSHTLSGGVTLNDVAMHVLIESLPCGGVGASGMGAYHGEQGFRTFSHARSIYRQTRIDIAGLLSLRPPYTARTRRALRLLFSRL